MGILGSLSLNKRKYLKKFKKVLDIWEKVGYNRFHLTDTFGGFLYKIRSKSRQVLSIKTTSYVVFCWIK